MRSSDSSAAPAPASSVSPPRRAARLGPGLVRATLRLELMGVVQRAIAPETGPLELAEILGSGLFVVRPNSHRRADAVWFDAAPDVRSRIADLAPSRDGVRVLET